MNRQKTGDPEKDLQRAREAGDSLRKFLPITFTGGIAVILTMAGSLAGEGVHPKWVVAPVAGFTIGLVFFALSLYMAEKRSLKRRKAAQGGATEVDIPVWMQGRTWTWICLWTFVFAVGASLFALNTLEVPKKSSEACELWI